MVVENHPKYKKWSKAIDKLKEAKDRYKIACDSKAKDVEVYRVDLHKTREDYDKISAEIFPSEDAAELADSAAPKAKKRGSKKSGDGENSN